MWPDTSKSQYGSYLEYVQQIGRTVGFHVQEDVLRIPSSKRVSCACDEGVKCACDEWVKLCM